MRVSISLKIPPINFVKNEEKSGKAFFHLISPVYLIYLGNTTK